jgi:mRNA-degrading endonuclease RelE of RelBE toxin-antitoxin system
MSDKAWEELIDLIDTKYQVDNTDRREEPLEDNKKLKKLTESIFFEKDNQKFKIDRVTSPRIIDKKTFYSGHNTANRIQYEYDPDEKSVKVLFFRQLPDGYWNELTPEDFSASILR